MNLRQPLLIVHIAEESYMTARLLLNKAEADVNKSLFDYELAISALNLKTSGALDNGAYNTSN